MTNNVNTTILITVGSTEFDSLIRAIDSAEFIRYIAKEWGCKKLVIQYGRGKYELKNILSNSEDIAIESFRYKPTLMDDMRAADLIISHAGAGSILEALEGKKSLVVVINEELMDNHQCELAEELGKDNYLICTRPSQLPQSLKTPAFFSKQKISFPKGDPANLEKKCLNNLFIYK